MSKIIKVAAAAVLTFPVASMAVDTTPTGQLNAQLAYDSETDEESSWSLAVPDSYVGVTVGDELNSGVLYGHVRAGSEADFTDEDTDIEIQQAYVRWVTDQYDIWAGQLPTLEESYITDYAVTQHSLSQNGLAVARYFDASEDNAVRVEYAIGTASQLSAQFIIDESEEDVELSMAYLLKSEEGEFALTYRKVPDEDAVWGSLISWDSGTAVMSAAWLYQDELVAWDYAVQADLTTFDAYLSYSSDEDDDSRWGIGGQYLLSDYSTLYSEVSIYTEDDDWAWASGLQITF